VHLSSLVLASTQRVNTQIHVPHIRFAHDRSTHVLDASRHPLSLALTSRRKKRPIGVKRAHFLLVGEKRKTKEKAKRKEAKSTFDRAPHTSTPSCGRSGGLSRSGVRGIPPAPYPPIPVHITGGSGPRSREDRPIVGGNPKNKSGATLFLAQPLG
jgi:hypothetical protein